MRRERRRGTAATVTTGVTALWGRYGRRVGTDGTPIEANGAGGAAAFCSSCGAALRPGLRFCPACGVATDLPAAGSPVATSPPGAVEAPRRTPRGPVIAGVAVVVVALAVVALAVVTRRGERDGAEAEVETTSTPASVAPATTSTTTGAAAAPGAGASPATSAPPPESVPAAPPPDLRNVTLPPDTCSWVGDYLALPSPLTLVDGAVPALDQYAMVELDERYPPSFEDLDGDGANEGIVVILCSAGGSGTTNEIHVFASSGEHLDGIVVGEGVEGRPMLTSMSVGSGTLTTTTSGTRPGEPLCCGTLPVVDTYSFDGRQLTLTDRQTG